MKINRFRLISKLFSVFLLTALIVGSLGIGVQNVLALTTVVDDIPGAAINIPDPASGASCTSSITRTFSVGALVVSDVNLGVNVSHPRRSDVRVTLTSPAGTTVPLISGGGLGSPVIASPDDYDNYDVLLDDSSINSLYDNDDDLVGAPLYDRNARPNEGFSLFKGEDGAGTWTLTICDTRNGEVGTYNQSQLIITSADPNTVTGVVFIDYSDNGIQDQGDTGVAGVTVTIYDAAGGVVATTVTNAQGGYTFTGITNGTQLRVEFSNIPANLRPGAFGSDSGTTVQFVTSPAAGVDLGLAKPDEYCQNNPWLISPCYFNGNPLGGGTASTAEVLISIPYDAYGRVDNTIENTLATGAQIGTTWGLAIQRSTGTIFAGALAKRHAGFGPLGAGGIYAIQMDPVTGAAISVNNFVDLTTIGITNVGTLGSNVARGLPNVSSTPNTDPTAWDAVGKSAIGDMDMGTDDETLWLINLANQTLYAIEVGNPPATPTSASVAAFPITPGTMPGGATACPASDIRPWAVEIHQGNIYIGVVCSAESTQNVNNLRAYVLSLNETAPAGFSLVTEVALNYPRGFATNPAFIGSPDSGYPAEWRPWSPTMTSLCVAPCASQLDLAFEKQIVYPQPILSDIEFDTNGDMILGFMDRLGHQTGNANHATSNPWDDNPADPAIGVTLYNKDTYATSSAIMAVDSLYEGVSAGDTIRLCSNGGGGFILENNGSCGGITTGGSNSAPGQGPGGGEYYWQDMFPPSTDKNSGIHNEITLGGLLIIPGTNEIAVSVFDPFEVRAGGVAWFNNLTGTRNRAYEVFGIDQGGGASTFGKAAGLGDIEGFCFNAPIEIGNRVWLDTDADGVQDADEAPIEGVTVELYDQNGDLIATAITDAEGNYFFSSGRGTSTPSQRYLIDGFGPNAQFEVRIPLIQPALAGLTLTINDANGNAEDQRDSDGVVNGVNAVVPVTTGNPGDNNHTYDFGFSGTYSLGNRVWLDDGVGGGVADNGIQDGTEAGIANVVVNLYLDANNDGIPDGGIIDTVTTDANGYYRFDDLTAGGYVVEIPAANFNAGGPLFSLGSSTPDEASPNSDVDVNDNGLGVVPDVLNGIRSGSVTLGPGTTEPVTEPDVPASGPFAGQGAPDNRANMTVDFGFVPPYSLGNRVWLDDGVGGGVADNGIQDGTELGIANVVVNLYRDANNDGNPDGGIIATVSTDANGYYRFDNLTAGGYLVEIPAVNFNAGNPLFSLASSTPDETNPNSDVDVNDNGIGIVPDVLSGIRSGTVTLGPGSNEPVTEPDVPVTGPFAGQGAPDNRANMTVDFGFVPSYSIGNRVWFDTDNDSFRDAAEVGVNGVVVQLYSVNAAGNFTLVATTTTANAGYYRFDGLSVGDYVVVLPQDNFTPGGAGSALVGYWSSGTTISNSGVTGEIAAPDADNDVDDDDNGTLQIAGTFANAVISSVVTLGPGTVEPVGEADLSPTGQGAIDARANMTVDFGFYRLELGDLVFEDINNNGTFDAGDGPLQGVLVQLFAANGTTEIITGADGIPGTADDGFGPDGLPGTPDDGQGGILTSASGLYLFSGLPQGSYVVKATGPIGYTSTIDTFDLADNANPDTNTNNNDNGIGTGAGLVTSAVVTLTPGSAGAQNNNTVTLNTGTTHNPTVDFGFVQANAAIIKSVTPAQATIGELVTYTVQVQIPPGAFANAQLVDTMETGLALFDCVNITGVGVTTSLAGGFGCTGNVTMAAGTGVDIDRIVTFNLGNLTNTGQTDGTITITYRAIVLDITANRGAATQTVLDNSALFSWTGGTLGPVTSVVTLIEPDLQIVKTSNTNFVAVGTEVEFTLTVTHTANSRADAFDVVVTDVIPAELDYVANSIICTDGDQDAALVNCTFDADTRTIIGEWNTFTRLPAGDDLIIRFRVAGNATLPPNGSVTNVGNVEWTSEPGDQTDPASFSNPPNPFATERFYDPASANPINTIYGDSDALVLNPVGGGGGGGSGRPPTAFTSGFLIADTGFDAGAVTPLDVAARPEYASIGLTLSIPSIKVNSSIAGVDLKDGNWDVSWLQDQAGWLEGTAYPTWSGNSVLTAHVVNADGKPGLFSRLKYLKLGDYVFVYNSGYRYTYRIVSNEYVQPDDISVLEHKEKPYLTLITCDGFDLKTKTYLRRVVVRAILIDVSAVR